jgi:hypothetical protein
MYLASGLPNIASGKDPKEKHSMAPTMDVARAIGWWIKERYRTMRGYKVRVSRLFAWCGNFLNAENGANLAGLLQ